MLVTARNHFRHDIARARALSTHSAGLPPGELADDLLRAAWMFAVGACDAYFSDAFGDLVSRALRAKDLQPAIVIPDRLNNLKVPVIAVLRQASGGWRWRMAARELIENENVLSLDKIRTLFNHFFRKSHRLVHRATIESWILHPNARSRLFGITGAQYKAKSAVGRGVACAAALEHFEEHFGMIFQRRHDCIHNCDRPRVALQAIAATTATKRIDDIEFLVERCHEAFTSEFPEYLRRLGFNGATRNQVCM